MEQGDIDPTKEWPKKPRMKRFTVLIEGTAPLIAPVWHIETIPLKTSSKEADKAN